MKKRIALALAIGLVCLSAESYTVILKNGKTMTGTLVSETADNILFKDEHGLQFSLKKTSLDLEKMEVANATPAEEPPAPVPAEEKPIAEKRAPASTKKAPRVYTVDDVEALKEKYGDLTTSDPPPPPAEETAPGAPAAAPVVAEPGEASEYWSSLLDASARVLALTKNMIALSTGIATVAEIASSSAQDPQEAIRLYVEGTGAFNLRNSINSDIKYLDELRSKLTTVPAGYEPAHNLYSKAVSELPRIKGVLDNPEAAADNPTRFQNNVKDAAANVDKIMNQLQAWQPPQPKTESEEEGEQ